MSPNSYRFQLWSEYMVSIIGIILNIILIEWPKLLIPCHLSTIYKKKSFNNNFYTHTANKWTIWLVSSQQRMTRSAQRSAYCHPMDHSCNRKLDSGFVEPVQCQVPPGTSADDTPHQYAYHLFHNHSIDAQLYNQFLLIISVLVFHWKCRFHYYFTINASNLLFS